MVPLAQVQRKVDVPAEDVGHGHDQVVRHARVRARLEKRTAYLAHALGDPDLQFPLHHMGLIAFLATGHMKAQRAIRLVDQFLEPAVVLERADLLAGVDGPQHGHVIAQGQDRIELAVNLKPAEDGRQGVSPAHFHFVPLQRCASACSASSTSTAGVGGSISRMAAGRASVIWTRVPAACFSVSCGASLAGRAISTGCVGAFAPGS
jgi:hypothetical protein